MRPQDKKALKVIRTIIDDIYESIERAMTELEELKDDHQNWMDERDYETDGKFSESPTGERAETDHDTFDDWIDRLDTMLYDVNAISDEIDEMF